MSLALVELHKFRISIIFAYRVPSFGCLFVSSKTAEFQFIILNFACPVFEEPQVSEI
jgi:hypothetical protein